VQRMKHARAHVARAALLEVVDVRFIPRITSDPRGQWISTEIRLPIVPEGTNSASSFPSSCAASI
jgi:hypothetical protein